jgi:FkbM family methyltransferase
MIELELLFTIIKFVGHLGFHKLKSFKYDGLDFAYRHTDHLISLAEVLLLDTYRADLLKEGDTAVDLGAGIGDFSIFASKKVGPNGKVIALEPNTDDYEILKMNIEKNGCTNVIALNMGVAEEPGQKEINFWDRRYSFAADTLENILARLKIGKKINFIKIDIEGFETGVIRNSITTIEHADIISIELHGTKKQVDMMLQSRQFTFMPSSRSRICKNFVSSMAAHPRATLEILLLTAKVYPRIVRMRVNEARHNDRLITGVYVKPAGRAAMVIR